MRPTASGGTECRSVGSPLRVRKLIPPLTLRQTDGRLVHAWDFKQKKNLVIALLDENCSQCENFIRDLANQASDLREQEAIILLAFLGEPQQSLRDILSDEFSAGAASAPHLRQFLGEDATSAERLSRRGVFVTDRYGEISSMWITQGHDFPRIEQILSALNLVEIACEECEVPFWPVDD